MASLLQCGEPEAADAAILALAALAAGHGPAGSALHDAIAAAGALPPLIALLASDNSTLVRNAAAALAGLSSDRALHDTIAAAGNGRRQLLYFVCR